MIVGIIAEYNPFHNGHLKQIEYAKNTLDADYIVVALSPDFTQRGEIACLSKYERARIALELSADLVVQIPINAATDSAQGYAYGGVKVLDNLGVIDTLLFSAEDDNINILNAIADTEINNYDNYISDINSYLKQGDNYPAAREKAITCYLSDNNIANLDNSLVHNILSKPNNILSLEYVKAIKQLGSNIKPVCMKRIGSDYNDMSINSDIASATAIRHAIYNINVEAIKSVVPSEAYEIYNNAFDNKMFLNPDDISLMLGYKILQGNLINYKDCTESLAYKIENEISNYTTYSEFTDRLKSKDITHTRISRVLCHILLDITKDMYYEENNCTYPYIPYIFILGMNRHGEELMSMIKNSCTLPYFTSYVDALDYDFGDACNNQSNTILDADINATRIANMIQANKTGAKVTSELSRKFLKI